MKKMNEKFLKICRYQNPIYFFDKKKKDTQVFVQSASKTSAVTRLLKLFSLHENM